MILQNDWFKWIIQEINLSLNCNVPHWKINFAIFTKFSSLAVLEDIRRTISGAANDENFLQIMTFPFQIDNFMCSKW